MRTMLSSPNLEKTRAQVIKAEKKKKVQKVQQVYSITHSLQFLQKALFTVTKVKAAIAHIPCLLCLDEN